MLWLIGGHIFYKQWWILPNFFGYSDLENTFSPINALFAALASAGAVYAIIIQAYNFSIQQFEINFFNLLNIHISNKDKVKYDIFEDRSVNHDIFFEFYELLKIIYTKANNPDYEHTMPKIRISIQDIIDDRLDMYRDDYGLINKDRHDIFKICHNIFNECTENILSPYFRNFYHLLKYIENSNAKIKNQFTGILRAQINNYEYALLYYDSLMNGDAKLLRKQSKIKSLLEKHCMFHNLDKRILFDNYSAGKYKKCAFEHRIDIYIDSFLNAPKIIIKSLNFIYHDIL
ncbi:putative phage abortive infection protein [Desulfomicrobium norvegicum]|nr:putative phage abortive infection protein [Desulfomicrobium norvegicum]